MMWNVCRIDDLGDINRGKSKHRPRNDARLFGGKYPFIQTGDVKKANLYITEFDTTYSEFGLAQSRLWPKDTLCITIAANIAESAILGFDACFPDSVVGFVPKKNKADLKFVKYLLDEFKVYMQQISKGTTQDNLSLDKLRRVKFYAPDYDVQVKIAKVISAYDDLIENNSRRIKILEKMSENLYKEWFSYKNIKKSAEYTRLSDILQIVRGISYSSDEINVEEGLNLINLKNIESYGGFRQDGTKKYDGKYKQQQVVCCGDLVMGVTDMTQDRRTVGSVAIVPKLEGTSVISADLIKISSSIDNLFLYAMFKYGKVSRHIAQFANGANVLHLKPQDILKIKVLLPKDNLISKYVCSVAPMFHEMEKLNLMNANLIKQRDMLLPRLMSGKLEV